VRCDQLSKKFRTRLSLFCTESFLMATFSPLVRLRELIFFHRSGIDFWLLTRTCRDLSSDRPFAYSPLDRKFPENVFSLETWVEFFPLPFFAQVVILAEDSVFLPFLHLETFFRPKTFNCSLGCISLSVLSKGVFLPY